MDSNNTSPKANGMRILTLVVVLLGITTAMFYNMVGSTNQRVNFLERQITTNTERMGKHDLREATDRNAIAAFREKFKEIETQFKAESNLRMRDEAEIIRMRTWISQHDRIIERRDAEQWERIKSLERRKY